MAGSHVGATFEEMRAGAARIIDVDGQISQRLSQLRNELAPLAGQWQGASATAFTNLMARYDSNALKISQALQAIAEQVQGSSATYVTEEEAQSQSFSGISNALDG